MRERGADPGSSRPRRPREARPARPAGPRGGLMDVLRTPDARFDDLPGYDFAPHYSEIPTGDGAGTLRVHHVDEGPPGAEETILLMHGEPSWSFLYRHMIPVLT